MPLQPLQAFSLPLLLVTLFLLLAAFLLRHPGNPSTGLLKPHSCAASRSHLNVTFLLSRGIRLTATNSGLRFAHSFPDPVCPRFIRSLQDSAAGVGHRAREWTTSLWFAATHNLTLVPSLVGTGVGVHGGYQGWDEFLGLGFGEDPDAAARLDLPAVLLPNFGAWGWPSEHITALWMPLIQGAGCGGTLFNTPGDAFPNDVSFEVKPYMAWKFAAAAAKRRLAGAALGPLLYEPSSINIGVHFRVGDAQPTPERTLFDTVRVVVSEFLSAGLDGELCIHVHAEAATELTHFGVADLPGGELVSLEVHTELDPRETFWHLSNADVFIGSQSEFSRLVGIVSMRPLVVLHHVIKEYCADTAICCDYEYACIEGQRSRIAPAAARLVAAQRCGNLGEHTSVADEAWPLDPQFALGR